MVSLNNLFLNRLFVISFSPSEGGNSIIVVLLYVAGLILCTMP